MRQLRPMSVLLTWGWLDRCDDDGADARSTDVHVTTTSDVSAADVGMARPM
jgi:hypothetical protein